MAFSNNNNPSIKIWLCIDCPQFRHSLDSTDRKRESHEFKGRLTLASSIMLCHRQKKLFFFVTIYAYYEEHIANLVTPHIKRKQVYKSNRWHTKNYFFILVSLRLIDTDYTEKDNICSLDRYHNSASYQLTAAIKGVTSIMYSQIHQKREDIPWFSGMYQGNGKIAFCTQKSMLHRSRIFQFRLYTITSHTREFWALLMLSSEEFCFWLNALDDSGTTIIYADSQY